LYADLIFSDACLLNLMMDKTSVVPKRSHFTQMNSHDGINLNLTWRHHCTVAPVQYFYIDFGLSGYYLHGQDSPTAAGTMG
jgi:hypothetical protein